MTLATNLMMSYRTKSQAIGRPRKDPITAMRLQNVGAHMPVVGPPRVCAVCSHVYSALHRRAQEENEEKGKRPRPPCSIISCEFCEVNLCLNSNSNCWVTCHTKTLSIVHLFNTFGLQRTGSESYSWLTLSQTVD